MPTSLAVIIPSLDEEESIGRAIASAFAAGADEVVVSDGGSSDGTVDRARAAGARIVTSERVRGRQLNAAASATASDILLFLHADTILPGDAWERIRSAVDRGAAFGGFSVAFIESDWRLRLVARLVNFRTRITRCPWGDQAQFVTRQAFQAEGGFREIPIMEDYDLAVRMKRRHRTAILTTRVRTSGRRFLRRGILRTTITNWRVILAWHLGADPERLATLYRG